MNKKMGAFQKILLWLLVPAIVLSCQTAGEDIQKDTAFCVPEHLQGRLSFDTASLVPITETRKFFGKVEANPDHVVHYTSLVNGIITQTSFSLGQYVRKGDVLAEIRSPELNELYKERRVLESQLQVAKRNTETVASMYEDGIASERSLLEAKSKEVYIRESLNQIQLNLSLYSFNEQQNVFEIKAPANGYVISKNITTGSRVLAEQTDIFTLADLSEVWITANIYAGDILFVKESMPVSIQTSYYGEKTFKGKIASVSQIFDPKEKVVKSRIFMKNPDLLFKPGMFVDVIVKNERDEQGLRFSEKALIFNNNKFFVLIYNDDCDIEYRQVDIISKDNGYAYVNKGVDEGEYIITKNHLLLFDAITTANYR